MTTRRHVCCCSHTSWFTPSSAGCACLKDQFMLHNQQVDGVSVVVSEAHRQEQHQENKLERSEQRGLAPEARHSAALNPVLLGEQSCYWSCSRPDQDEGEDAAASSPSGCRACTLIPNSYRASVQTPETRLIRQLLLVVNTESPGDPAGL